MISISNNFPSAKGDKKDFLFEDCFNPYQRISIGMTLIPIFTGSNKLSKCPVNVSPKYVINNIYTTGFLFWKKTYVTIEKI